MITIVGAGPRGIAVALVALDQGLEVTLIDPYPFSSWEVPQTLPDFEMRSPLTFDLVTGAGKSLQTYSLATFLNREVSSSSDQRELEACSDRATRAQFSDYLQHVFHRIKPQLNYIAEPAISIKAEGVLTPSRFVKSSKIIIALGAALETPICPDWIAKSQYKDRVIELESLIHPEPGRYLVIGSGQRAAEMLLHLSSQGCTVALAGHHSWKPHQYPVPDYQSWFHKTALGPYYQSIQGPSSKREYLKQVKAWQPTVSPLVYQALKSLNYEHFHLDSTQLLQEWLGEDGHLVLASGRKFNFDQLPLSKPIKASLVNSQWPELNRFRLNEIPSIYFTGTAALAYGGPAQGSIISAARTAKEILHD